MQLALVGLGRMGLNMARRLLRDGHQVAAYNRTFAKTEQIMREGAVGAASLEEVVALLKPPRVVWLMLPEGAPTEEHLTAFAPLLSPGDLLVDGGNSFFRDDLRRAEWLRGQGLHYADVGVSGGIWGLEQGYCLMVGGEAEDFARLEPALRTLAPAEGYLHCGPVGAGHYLKMVHNGIEYALMEAYGEGLEILKASPYGSHLNLEKIAHLWNRGSVIRSWLLELLETALGEDPDLARVAGYVEDSGEGRWTVQQAVELGVAADGIAHALFKRFLSRQAGAFSNKVVAALRYQFGGHPIATPEEAERPTGAAGETAPSRPGPEARD